MGERLDPAGDPEPVSNVLQGTRGRVTSSSTPSEPMRQRSPMTAPVTSIPDVVRFSPNMPFVSSRLELGLPRIEILPGVGVDRLIVAAVHLLRCRCCRRRGHCPARRAWGRVPGPRRRRRWAACRSPSSRHSRLDRRVRCSPSTPLPRPEPSSAEEVLPGRRPTVRPADPTRRFSCVMLALLLPLAGFAFLDSLNLFNLGVTTAVVYDSRLGRRSPLPAGLSFIAGVFAATTTVGICVVLGPDLPDQPRRRRGDADGALLGPTRPGPRAHRRRLVVVVEWAATTGVGAERGAPQSVAVRRRRIVVGLGQAVTSVPYLSALTMISARERPADGLARDRDRLLRVRAGSGAAGAWSVGPQDHARPAGCSGDWSACCSSTDRSWCDRLFLGIGVVLVGDALWHWR